HRMSPCGSFLRTSAGKRNVGEEISKRAVERNRTSSRWSLLSLLGAFGRVQRHCRANERLERLFIDLVALVDIDGAPRVAFKAGVEEAGRVLERGALRERHLHNGLVA